jgi:hypothetical protein
MSDEKKVNVNDPDHDDPVLAELRQIREEFVARFDYDFDAIGRHLRKQERRHPPGTVVSLPLRDVSETGTAAGPQTVTGLAECRRKRRLK